MKSWILLSTLGLALMLSAQYDAGQVQQRKCVAQRYTLTALPLRPSGINDTGQVVGTTDSHHAALWTKTGGLQQVGVPPGFNSSEGVGLNREGHIVGVAVNLKTNQRQGFTYVNGTLRLLSGSQARPFAINDADEIAGESTMPDGPSVPVIWKGLNAVQLGGCCGGVASGINNHSQAVGNVYDQQGRYEAFLWDKIGGIRLMGPPNAFSSALAINDAGHVLVQSFSQGVLLYQDGKLNRLALSPTLPNHPRALNNCDVIVGVFGPFSDSGHAFVWDRAEGFRDLNDLIAPHSGWQLREATAINSQGEIVGWGEQHRDETAGFLLVPQP